MSVTDPTPQNAFFADLSPGFTGKDLTSGSETVRRIVRNTGDLQIAVRDASGGSVDVSVDFKRNDGTVISSMGPADVLQGVTDGEVNLTPYGAIAVVVFESNSAATDVSAEVTTGS